MSKVFVLGVFLVRIQSECGKIRTRKTPNTDTFHTVLNIQSTCQVQFFLPFASLTNCTSRDAVKTQMLW